MTNIGAINCTLYSTSSKLKIKPVSIGILLEIERTKEPTNFYCVAYKNKS
jgi:hypothetical protein